MILLLFFMVIAFLICRGLAKAGLAKHQLQQRERLSAALELQELEAKIASDTRVDLFIHDLEEELRAEDAFDSDESEEQDVPRLRGCA